jgi:hypothetical protein
MSTKTLRKRIALGTVAALSAGLMSVVSTTAAHATTPGRVTISTASSAGVLGSDLTTPLASTANVLATGTLALNIGGTGGGYYTVSAGAYFSGVSGADTNAVITGNQSVVTSTGDDTVTITPTGAAGSTFTVVGTTAKGAAAVTVLVVTIAGTSVAGTADASKSYVTWVASTFVGNSGDSKVDVSGASATTAGKPLYVAIDLKDAYSNVINKAGALAVTVTDGAVATVGIEPGDTSTVAAINSTAGVYTTAVSSVASTNGRYYARVDEKTAGTGWSGTVTVSYNGVVLATKAATIAGYVKKIVLSTNKVAQKGVTTTDVVRYNMYDASGNAIDGPAITSANISKNSIGTSSVLTSIQADDTPTVSTATAGKIEVTAGSSGSSTLVVQYVNPDGSIALSNSVTVNVGDSANTYKIALDKTSYNQGDLATLTITVLDIKGNPTNSSVNVIDSSTVAAGDLLISTPMLTLVGAYPAVKKVGASGTITFTYTVGTTGTFTPGNYQASVSLPTVNAVNGVAQTIAYAVANPAGGTSLNDVLKGIVSLIASINKQIAALAKLVAKK